MIRLLQLGECRRPRCTFGLAGLDGMDRRKLDGGRGVQIRLAPAPRPMTFRPPLSAAARFIRDRDVVADGFTRARRGQTGRTSSSPCEQPRADPRASRGFLWAGRFHPKARRRCTARSLTEKMVQSPLRRRPLRNRLSSDSFRERRNIRQFSSANGSFSTNPSKGIAPRITNATAAKKANS